MEDNIVKYDGKEYDISKMSKEELRDLIKKVEEDNEKLKKEAEVELY